MANIFTGFHGYAAKRKKVFSFFLLLLVFYAVFLATRLNLQEDIRAIIPDDERINKISSVLNETKFSDRLIFTYALKNIQETNTSLLIEAASYTVDLLKKDSLLIQSILFKSDDSDFLKVYDFIYNNLPLYLDKEAYAHIATLLTEENIEKTLARNYATLSSLVGLVTKEFIFKDPLSITPLALEKLERFRLDDNFIIHDACIFTKDQKHLLFFLNPTYPSSNTKENKKLIAQIEKALSKTRDTYSSLDISYYGGTAVAVTNASRIKQDIMLTVTIALLLLFLLFYFIFRNIKNIVLIFFPLSLGILFSLAFMSLSSGDISAIALGIGAILIGISLDYSLHAFTHFRSSGSVKETLEGIASPVMMSCLSTASAFLTLYIVKSQALNQLGLFAAVAIIATAILVLTVIPFFLKNSKPQSPVKKIHNTLFDKLAAYRFEKNKYILWSILLLSIVFIFTSRRLGFNSDISTMNYLSKPLIEAEEKIKNISSQAHSAVYFVVQGHSFEEALQKTEKHEELLKQAVTDSIISSYTLPSSLIPSKEVQKEKIALWNEFWNDTRKENTLMLLSKIGKVHHFHQDAFKDFFTLIDKEFVIQDFEAFRLINKVFLSNNLSKTDSLYTALSIIKAEQNKKDKLFEVFSDKEDMIIFDNQYFTNSFLDVLKDDFRLLVIISMLVVFSILLLFFGRIEIAVITFAPILLSWFWTIGMMGLFGVEFNIFNIIISTFILGLGVDYSIFVMSGLINNYKYGKNNLTPYKLSVLLSAATTILCLGVLVFAKHPALQSIAIVSIFGILSVIIITYTVLPLLFSFIIYNKGVIRQEPVTMLNFGISIITLFIYLLGTMLATLLLPIIMILPARKSFKKAIVHHFICWSSRFIVYMNITIRKNYVNKEKLDFSKPVIFVSNHQSHLDLVLMLLINPKIIVLTNNWVWNSPFFGSLVRYAGFYPAFRGLDYGIEKIETKVKQGYSVLIFPEGSRTPDGRIRRFHQGAFYLADKLKLEIQPVIIHGAMQSLGKTEFFLKSGDITLTFYDRFEVAPANIDAGESYRKQAQDLTAFYRTEFNKIRKEREKALFFKRKIIAQYIYKGPVLEWYMRIKLKLENYYTLFHQNLPENGKILDIGCGYGFMSYMLAFLSNERTITGLDYDAKKIAIAHNCAAKTSKITFVSADIFDYTFDNHDAFIISDVLHYFDEDKQAKLIEKCISKLNPGGVIMIRDADNALKKRHWGTRYTEFFSTKSGFNKMKEGRLFFTSREKIENMLAGYALDVEIIDNTKLTSNIVFIIRKKEI